MLIGIGKGIAVCIWQNLQPLKRPRFALPGMQSEAIVFQMPMKRHLPDTMERQADKGLSREGSQQVTWRSLRMDVYSTEHAIHKLNATHSSGQHLV